ncbi:MAG TPA: HEAT repeat domain-containing protein [Ktedonobacteraceae bacterium]|nr:HEAT repeat domain-containing protein [Ktedonobacteraceae bacterium]
MRIRATRRLARQGPEVLPLILMTLSSYPEITTPAWPWWPPQYEHCSRLLLHLSKKLSLSLSDLLYHPELKQPAGPVLWISILEADANNENLLRQGLTLPWTTARYAAAMALAIYAGRKALSAETLDELRHHQQEHEEYPIRLSASYALLVSGESIGLEALLQLMKPFSPIEARKAALFILATELPFRLTAEEHVRITEHLLVALRDYNIDIAFHAAHALSKIAQPALIPIVSELLWQNDPQLQIVVLSALEEMARRGDLRRKMRHLSLPMRLLPLLQSEVPALRRQACCTLAACGGEFVTAVLGTLVLSHEHPGHLEALESLRLLQGALHAKMRSTVVRWLLKAVQQHREEAQITALDSLAYLLWQAHIQRRKQAWHDISQAIIQDGSLFLLLDDPSAWVRQRTIELLCMFDKQLASVSNFHARLLNLLHDPDSGVRACVAFVCGQTSARWAIPELMQTLLDSDEYVAETALNALAQMMTPEDDIISYVIQELAGFNNPILRSTRHLNQAAQVLLKQKQKARKREGR